MTVDPELFRSAISRVPLPVAIVTVPGLDGGPSGFTASSICSLSVSPPSLLVCVDHTTRSCDVMRDCEEFGVDYLSTEHQGVARLFATSGADKFGSPQVVVSDGDPPRIAASLLHLRCKVEHRFDSFDHLVVIGSVYSIEEHDGRPLLIERRAFTSPEVVHKEAAEVKRLRDMCGNRDPRRLLRTRLPHCGVPEERSTSDACLFSHPEIIEVFPSWLSIDVGRW